MPKISQVLKNIELPLNKITFFAKKKGEEYLKCFKPDLFGNHKALENEEERFFEMAEKLRTEALMLADISDRLLILRDEALSVSAALLSSKKSSDESDDFAKTLQRQAVTVSSFYDIIFEEYSRSIYAEIMKPVCSVGNINRAMYGLSVKLKNLIFQITQSSPSRQNGDHYG